jgi:hypothetical protein
MAHIIAAQEGPAGEAFAAAPATHPEWNSTSVSLPSTVVEEEPVSVGAPLSVGALGSTDSISLPPAPPDELAPASDAADANAAPAMLSAVAKLKGQGKLAPAMIGKGDGAKNGGGDAMQAWNSVLKETAPCVGEGGPSIAGLVAAKRLTKKKVSAHRAQRRRLAITRWKMSDFFLGTSLGQIILLCSVAFFFIFWGALAWLWVGENHQDQGGEFAFPQNAAQAIWLSWGIFFDPGTQTSLDPPRKGDLTPHGVAFIFSVCGFIFNLVFLGVIVEFARGQLRSWEVLYGRIVMNDHIVVLGWTDMTLFVLSELDAMFAGHQLATPIIVLGDLPEEKMHLEIRTQLQHINSSVRSRIYVRQGKPYEVDDLDRVSISSARCVIVLGSSRVPRIADSRTVTTLLALHAVRQGSLVLAEVHQTQTVDVLAGLFGEGKAPFDVVGVTASGVVDQILSLCALEPTVGAALIEILTFDDDALVVSEQCASLNLVGQTFSAAQDRFPLGVVFGLVEPNGTLLIAPPKDRRFAGGDRLIMVNQAKVKQKRGRGGKCVQRHTGECYRQIRITRGLRTPTVLVRTTERLAAEPWRRTEKGLPAGVVCILGWRHGIGNVLKALDARLPEGSEIHMLSEKSLEQRELELLREGVFTRREGGIMTTLQCSLRHHVGISTRRDDVEQLPLKTATACIVLADMDRLQMSASEKQGGEELQVADSETVIAVELLQQLRGGITSVLPRLTIVAEVFDFLTFRVFQTDESLLCSALKAASKSSLVLPFHRKHLEAATLCVSTQLPSLGHALEALTGLLVRRRGKANALRVQLRGHPVEEVLGTISDPLSFYDIQEKTDGVVLGWVRQGDIIVNPKDKVVKFKWEKEDQILVCSCKAEKMVPGLLTRKTLPRLPSFEDTGRGD